MPAGSTLDVGDVRALSAVVLNAEGAALTDRAVTWTSLEPTIVSVGNGGTITGLALGKARIVAIAEAHSDTAIITVFERSPYTIEIRFLGDVPPRVRTAAEAAVARWRRVIRGDLPDVPVTIPAMSCGGASFPALSESVDDLVVFVGMVGAAGSSGNARTCWARSDGRPLIVLVQIRSDHVELMFAQGWGDNLFVHELGHAVGLNEMTFSRLGLISTTEPFNPVFTGAQAKMAMHRVIEGFPTGMQVPLEIEGGSPLSHWRLSVLDSEVMTRVVGSHSSLSAISVGALADMGYQVDIAASDPFRGRTALIPSPHSVVLTEEASSPLGYISETGRVVRHRMQ